MAIEAPPPVHARLDELGVFIEVASSGSIAAAARRLGVPKSTVGRAIARMERDLGTLLVRRMARGQTLTEAGRLLALNAAPHVNALRDLSAGVGREADEVFGTLRVTAPADIGTLVLAPLIAAFTARHPRIRIEVELSMRVVDLVREGFDLAIRIAATRSLPSSTLIARKLARLELGLYAGATYLARRSAPKRADDLLEHEHVLFNGREGRSVLVLEDARGTQRLSVKGRVVSNDFFFVREAILSGAGIGPLPWFVAESELAAGRLIRVLPDQRLAGSTAYLVHPPLKAAGAKLDMFRSFLFEKAPRLLAHP
jgi:DNA-binding transcriptional LysR family regulator